MIRVELRKLSRRPRTWISLFLLCALPIAVAIFLVFAHLFAWYFVGRYVNVGTEPDKPALVVVTGTVLLSWSLLMSQAMESVTRAFYARSDLDLILTSPVSAPVKGG